MMASIKYKDLPKELQALFLKRAHELKLGSNINNNTYITSIFTFSASEEGHDFWRKIADGDFEVFYERFPYLKESKVELISEKPIIYKGIINNKKVKITIEYEDTIE